MESDIIANTQYREWLKELKQKVRLSQLTAAVAVNTALLKFYWELGADIVKRQKTAKWGSGFLKQLSADLMAEFPDMKGFSKRNLECIRQWHLFYSEGISCSETGLSQIVQQPVAQLSEQLFPQLVKIPWRHNLVIISKCQSLEEAIFYVKKTLDNNWSRAVLTHQIESGLHNSEGKAITNFSQPLPAPYPGFNPVEFDGIKKQSGLNSFTLTPKQWKEKNPDSQGNIRDHAGIEQLPLLANVESMNAELIRRELSAQDRLLKLNAIAFRQMKSLTTNVSLAKQLPKNG